MYGVVSLSFNLRHNASSFAFWSVSMAAWHREAVDALMLVFALYLLLDGRVIAWAIGRSLPQGDSHACPKCGYDLTGETGPGCSECGWGRDAGAERESSGSA